MTDSTCRREYRPRIVAAGMIVELLHVAAVPLAGFICCLVIERLLR
jgi:hypothetical protein